MNETPKLDDGIEGAICQVIVASMLAKAMATMCKEQSGLVSHQCEIASRSIGQLAAFGIRDYLIAKGFTDQNTDRERTIREALKLVEIGWPDMITALQNLKPTAEQFSNLMPPHSEN